MLVTVGKEYEENLWQKACYFQPGELLADNMGNVFLRAYMDLLIPLRDNNVVAIKTIGLDSTFRRLKKGTVIHLEQQ